MIEEKTIELDKQLLMGIKNKMLDLEALLKEINDEGVYEDFMYRLYHQSYKAYNIQEITNKIIETLKGLAPKGVTLNKYFNEICKNGTGKKFDLKHNSQWLHHARPLLEAFFHARFFLEMVVKYGKELEETPLLLPSGWACLLELYNLR